MSCPRLASRYTSIGHRLRREDRSHVLLDLNAHPPENRQVLRTDAGVQPSLTLPRVRHVLRERLHCEAHVFACAPEKQRVGGNAVHSWANARVSGEGRWLRGRVCGGREVWTQILCNYLSVVNSKHKVKRNISIKIFKKINILIR